MTVWQSSKKQNHDYDYWWEVLSAFAFKSQVSQAGDSAYKSCILPHKSDSIFSFDSNGLAGKK